MKPYFVKYLPVEGEIKMGDIIVHGNTQLKEGWNWGYHTIKTQEDLDHFTKMKELMEIPIVPKTVMTKVVKLFLCSKDVKEGDTVSGKWLQGDQIVEFYNKIYGEVEGWVRFSLYKTIGEISPEAEWAKEGDEFEEDEVRFIDEPGEDMDTEYVPLNEFEAYYKTKGYRKPFPYYILNKTIALKGPCGHFH